jgi:hypothetical protein
MVAALVAAPLLGACSVEPTNPAPSEPTASATAPIINGVLDPNRPAVVAVLSQKNGQGGACTGTIIQVDVPSKTAHVLTAAHCVDPLPPVAVIQGDDYESTRAIRYSVLDYVAHPDYSGRITGGAGSAFDFAIVRIVGADATTPVLKYLAPSEDRLARGTPVVSVGYGRTTPIDEPRSENSKRYRIARTLTNVTSTMLVYSLDGGGICSGDSGGPVLVDVDGEPRVAGVHSFVSNNCKGDGYSGRVSAVDGWIRQQLGAPAPTNTCQVCLEAARSGNSVCAQQERACSEDAQCGGLSDCLAKCDGDAACRSECVEKFRFGVGPLISAASCTCVTACARECAGSAACADTAKCGASLSPGTCSTCAESKCCAELAAATADGVAYDCLRRGDTSGACASNSVFNAYRSCLSTKCTSECGSGTSRRDAGAPTSGDADGGVDGTGGGVSTVPATEETPGSKKITRTTSICSASPLSANDGAGLGFVSLFGGLGIAAALRRRRTRVHA